MARSIDPSTGEPWTHIPYGPPVEKSTPASQDLVVCPHYLIDNRWKRSNELVDYSVVEQPTTTRVEAKNWHIRRLKIFRIPRLHKLYLLKNLEQSDLVQLEIDKLEVVQRKLGSEVTTFQFPNLEVIAIGKIVTVDDAENRLPYVQTPVHFNAIVLKEVHLGKYLSRSI